MARVLIAEDQSMVLGALAALLELEDDIEVVARAPDGDRALELLTEHRPDILLTDIEMPGLSGLELAQRAPTVAPDCRTIILTTFARKGYLHRALEAKVGGYVLKDAPAEELAATIRKVQRGERVIDPELALEAWDAADPLGDGERRILRLAGEGLTGPQIAERVHLSEGTVRNYLSEAIHKLGAGNRVEAARIARRNGWL